MSEKNTLEKLIKQLARRIIGIPASSAASERLFSVAGRVLEERRTRLKSENVDKIIFLHNNLKYVKFN